MFFCFLPTGQIYYNIFGGFLLIGQFFNPRDSRGGSLYDQNITDGVHSQR